jgi:hypothetical protein
VAHTNSQNEALKSLNWIIADELRIQNPSILPLKSVHTGNLKLQLFVESNKNNVLQCKSKAPEEDKQETHMQEPESDEEDELALTQS